MFIFVIDGLDNLDKVPGPARFFGQVASAVVMLMATQMAGIRPYLAPREWIQQQLAQMGLANDPAFRNQVVAIEPIPCRDHRCPLGLYDPGTGNITLPPKYTEAALKHEFGHRFFHYHHRDLSESAAERFRMRYMPKGALLALEPVSNLNMLPHYEVLFDEGQKGYVEAALRQPLNSAAIRQLRANTRGDIRISQYSDHGVPVVRFSFTKGHPALPAILLAIGALGFTGVFSYGLFKSAESAEGMISGMTIVAVVGTLALVVVGGLVTYGLLKKPKK